MKKRLLWRLLILSTLIGVVLSACNLSKSSGNSSSLPVPTLDGTYTIAPPLKEFYLRLGGQEVLGPPISTMYQLNSKYMQYTEKALLVLDPASDTIERYTLSPIGLQLDILEAPRTPLADESFTSDGYPLHKDFTELYTLFGPRFTGRTLTNPILRTDLNRIEQYFENVAFVIDLIPGATPRLLSYGVYDCDFNCRLQASAYENTEVILNLEVPPPFAADVDRLGINLVGIKIAGPYIAHDGNPEMVFSNIVLYYVEAEDRVYARNIALSLGFDRDAAQDLHDAQNYAFYATFGEMGYNVKRIGQEFISQHGGLDIMGMPITEVFIMGGLEWQCFANMCLTYDPSQPEAFQVKPAALGNLYFELTYDESTQTIVTPPIAEPASNSTEASSGLILVTTEEFAYINPLAQQVLHLEAFQQDSPLFGAILQINISAPGIDPFTIQSPPINENGQAIVILPVIAVPNDTLVTYNVCLDNVCIESNFLIWELD